MTVMWPKMEAKNTSSQFFHDFFKKIMTKCEYHIRNKLLNVDQHAYASRLLARNAFCAFGSATGHVVFSCALIGTFQIWTAPLCTSWISPHFVYQRAWCNDIILSLPDWSDVRRNPNEHHSSEIFQQRFTNAQKLTWVRGKVNFLHFFRQFSSNIKASMAKIDKMAM